MTPGGRKLHRQRAHGLIERAAHSYSYEVSVDGYKQIILMLQLRQRIYDSIASDVLQQPGDAPAGDGARARPRVGGESKTAAAAATRDGAGDDLLPPANERARARACEISLPAARVGEQPPNQVWCTDTRSCAR